MTQIGSMQMQSPVLSLCTTTAQVAPIYNRLESKTEENSTEYEFAYSIQYYQVKYAYIQYMSVKGTLIYINQHMDAH